MPASFRNRPVDVFTSGDVGSGGVEQLGYTRVANADPTPGGGKWWAHRGPPRASERQVAAQMQQEIDTIFGFGIEARNALTPTGKIRDDGEWYSIVGIAENIRFQSIAVTALTVDDEPDPSTVVE